MTQLADYLPQAASWFSNTLTYSGRGRIEFLSPKGWVEGEFSCEVSRLGEMTVIVKVQVWHNSEMPSDPTSVASRDWLVSGVQLNSGTPWPMYPEPMPIKNTIVSIDVEASDGGRLTSKDIPHYAWNPIENTMKLYLDLATFIANNQSKTNAKYWVLPCINVNLKHPFGITQAHKYTELWQHPLRVFPVPERTRAFLESEAPEQDKAWVFHNLTALSYVVGFLFDGKPAFIERLPDYDRIIQDLMDGQSRLDATSLMVGVYSSEVDEMRPLDLLPVLGLATGRPVGASWIEFRNEDTNLVYRIHGNLGRFTYGHGRPVVHDVIHRGGLGQLLTEAARSTMLSEPLIRGALRNTAHAISGGDATTIFYYTFTAFDGLFTRYSIEQKIHPLTSFLSQSQIDDIKRILVQTKTDIESLKTKITNPNSIAGRQQSSVIDKVANKARSQPLEKRSRFGDKLVALMMHFGISDMEVLATHYPDIEVWITQVNDYRNTTMHATHYENVFDPGARQNFEFITPHLIDILIRILLKTVGYTGNYAPYMETPNSSESLDWVTPTSSANSLGYK
ncbi:MAG: hypothetical protein KJ047_05330 [Anaerolineae bacterium]|nr:hypothetical protein [Anaerolineae bacterium]